MYDIVVRIYLQATVRFIIFLSSVERRESENCSRFVVYSESWTLCIGFSKNCYR